MRSRTQNTVINTAFALGSQGIEAILKFVGRTIFIKCLSVTYLGVSGLFSEILTMLSLAELGIGSSIVYAMYKPLKEHDEDKLSALMRLYKKAYIIIGLATVVIGVSLIPFLKYIIKDPGELSGEITKIYAFYIFNTAISYFFSYKSSILTADQRGYVVHTVKEICNITRTIIQSVILLVYHNFYAYLAVESVLILMNNVVVSMCADRRYPFLKTNNSKLEKKDIVPITKNIRALFLVKINTIILNSTDNTLISALGGIAEVGYYSNYSMFTTLFTSVLGNLFAGLSASVGNLNAEDDREKSLMVFDSLHLINFWLYSWVSIGIAIMLNPVIEVWLGKEYLLPQICVYVIAINFYIMGMQKVVWIFKDTYGLFKYGKYMGFMTSAINIVLSIVLGKIYGLIGILAATSVARLCTGVWYDSRALFKYGFQKPVRKYFIQYVTYAALCFLTFFATYLICMLVPYKGIVGAGLKMFIAIVIPNAMYFLIFHRTKEMEILLDRAKSVIPDKFRRK